MVNNGEQSVIAAATEPSVEPARPGGGGGRRRLVEESSGEEEEGSLCFSDAEDRSWRSHSRQDSATLEDFSACASVRSGAGEADGEGAAGDGRKSCVSECSLDDVDLEAGLDEITKASPDTAERNCRICHLGLESADVESGSGMFLGCSCKADLSCAHKQCAETSSIQNHMAGIPNFSCNFDHRAIPATSTTAIAAEPSADQPLVVLQAVHVIQCTHRSGHEPEPLHMGAGVATTRR